MKNDDKIEYKNDEERDQVSIEVLLRISSLERLLISKGIVTEKEVASQIEESSAKFLKAFMSLVSAVENKVQN